MRLSRTLAFVVAAVPLTLVGFDGAAAQSGCIRESMANQIYCGSESKKISRHVPDKPLGNFRGACATHDQCYASGGVQVLRLMESRYHMSLLRPTPQQRNEVKADAKRIKASCDSNFRQNMYAACRDVPFVIRDKCDGFAELYYVGVVKLAGDAFDQAIDYAFSCRNP
jgi:hypothetical protein